MPPTTSAAVTEAGLAGASRRKRHVFVDLLIVLTMRDIKVKYKQSVMGLAWAVLMPAIIVGAGLLIRIAMAKMSGRALAPEDVASISVKALPWAFVVSALRFATSSLASNRKLVTKINCPRIVFPIAAVLSSFFDLAVAALPLALILAWYGIAPGAALAWLPLLLALLVLQVTGLAVALAAANLYFRDVKYLVEVVLTFAIFFTPVLYEAEMLGEWRTWVLLNPVAPLLEGLRAAVVLNAAPDAAWTAYSAAVSMIVFAAGWWLFRRLEPGFADIA